jgi:helicase
MTRTAIPAEYKDVFAFTTLRPSQEKAIAAGLLQGTNILVATPTASGKTMIGLLALTRAVRAGGKGVYLVPLKALAAEKARDVAALPFSSALTVGDFDEDDASLAEKDIIITTPEKLDSLVRHGAPWLARLGCVVVDEIHLLGETKRGPTLELLLTLLRHIAPNAQLVGLSATIHNAPELAAWLGATLVEDNWRPVELREGTWTQGGIVYKK